MPSSELGNHSATRPSFWFALFAAALLILLMPAVGYAEGVDEPNSESERSESEDSDESKESRGGTATGDGFAFGASQYRGARTQAPDSAEDRILVTTRLHLVKLDLGVMGRRRFRTSSRVWSMRGTSADGIVPLGSATHPRRRAPWRPPTARRPVTSWRRAMPTLRVRRMRRPMSGSLGRRAQGTTVGTATPVGGQGQQLLHYSSGPALCRAVRPLRSPW